MNLLHISYLNKKGQFVIPKNIRKTLKINSETPLHIITQGNSIFIKPIKDLIYQRQPLGAYTKTLQKTLGSWGTDTYPKTRQKRRKLELQASKKRKRSW